MIRNRAVRLRPALPLLAFLLLFAVQLAYAERRERVVDAWRPLDYDVSLTLNDQLTEVTSARTKISIYVLKAPLAVVDLDFGAMPVDSVLVGDKTARFEQGQGRLLVTLPKPASRDERLEIIVSYHGRPADGLILMKDKAGRPSATGDNWPDRVHHWIPCLDHPSAKATVRFNVTAPSRVLVVANGQLKDKRENADKTLTWVYTESKPIPAYCMIIAAGEFALLQPTERTSTPLSYYVPQTDKDYAVKGFSAAPFAVDFFSERVAPYPYEKLALIVGATRFGGMENSSAIVFPGSLFNERTSGSNRFGIRSQLLDVTAHEIAHQWFGDSVTETTWADLWLSEGFATYFAGLFIEKFDGQDAFRAYMRRQADTYYVFEKEHRIPLHDTETPELFALLNGNNYQKGAWVLHMLRGMLGDTVFFRGIREYYDAHKEGNANSEDLRAAMEKASGQDLKGFFKSWVYGSGHPRYEVTWAWTPTGIQQSGTLNIAVKQTQSDEAFLTPLAVEIVMQGSAAKRELIRPTGKEALATFSLPRRPEAVRIDPDDFVLKEISVREARQAAAASN